MTRIVGNVLRLASVLALPFLFVVFDVLLDKGDVFLSWSGASWGIWLTGFAWDLSAWLTFLWLASRLIGHPRRWVRNLGWFLVVLDSVGLASASLVSAAYHAEYHNLPNVQALYFAFANWRNTLTLSAEYVDPRGILAMIVAAPILFWMHKAALSAREALSRGLTSRLWLLAGTLPLLLTLWVAPLALGWHRFQEPLPLLANWSRIFFQAGLGLFGNKTNLQTPARLVLPRGKPTWNIVLILNESLRADALHPGLGLLDSLDPRTLSPRMSAWVGSEDMLVFPMARANATATSVSVPSLITGVAASGTTYQFHRSPTFFTAAKSAGLRTFLLSSQDWRWEHFDEFAFGGIDRIVHRSSFAAERNNDLGVDDSLLLDSLDAMLAPEGKFFGLIQLNSNHGPFWPGPTRTHLANSSRERYQASVEYVDGILHRIVTRLARDPRWDSTFVFLVSDHAENIGARKIGRINSFYEETVRIPFVVRLPPALRPDGPERAALQAWTTQPVQLVDLMPSFLDLWHIPVSALDGLASGASLLAPPPASRVQGGQNTGDIRSWDVEGLYLARGHWKLVLSQGRPPGLFDLSIDPREERSLWDTVRVRESQIGWIREAMRDPIRQGVCNRAGESCPAELRSPQ